MTQRSGARGHAIVLFDGTCAFCAGAVAFIASRDPDGYFRFSAAQSPRAAGVLLAQEDLRHAARSIVLIEEDGSVHLRSSAVLRIAAHLTWPWSMARLLLVAPAPVRDVVYRLVASVRHRLARQPGVCGDPPAIVRQRMI